MSSTRSPIGSPTGNSENSSVTTADASALDTVFVPPPLEVVGLTGDGPLHPPEEPHRAVHRIHLSALTHNYHQVEAAASRQKCSVITVVKADAYGHGAAAVALHLADHCGADAFAVATLEEAIALRKAFAANPPGRWSKQLASMFHTQHHHDVVTNSSAGESAVAPYLAASAAPSTSHDQRNTVQSIPTRRPAQIRIVVLGPPVGFPRCFDDYYHHNIEVMVSGPEVAKSLMHWVADAVQRKKVQVERMANEAKYAALYSNFQERDSTSVTVASSRPANDAPPKKSFEATASVKTAGTQSTSASSASTHISSSNNSSTASNAEAAGSSVPATKKVLPHQSSTLGNVQGFELAREVRSILLNQHEAKLRHQQSSNAGSAAVSENCSVDSNDTPPTHGGAEESAKEHRQGATANVWNGMVLFGGIEAAARSSRHDEAAAARARAVLYEDDDEDYDPDDQEVSDSAKLRAVVAAANSTFQAASVAPYRKKLRWHALVDSGMGRLGFRTEIVKAGDKTGRQDTVAVLQEMLDLEIEGNAPLEFYGMCTHMADARDLSDYTNSQITKFVALLKRVRAAGISVPTVSTDNSAALLTTSLNHFDPVQMLAQTGADTRGYVRTGGAIYGQRPAFKQLRAVSTLLASVRHVAILKKGDTVGYDRAYVAPHDVRIATLTIGFADGYPRELGNGVGRVQIRGATFPVAGNVCMDMLMVDLGPSDEKTGVGATVVVGDTAILWGPLDEDLENRSNSHGMVRLQDIASTLKTTQSALTCGLDKIRVRRQFV